MAAGDVKKGKTVTPAYNIDAQVTIKFQGQGLRLAGVGAGGAGRSEIGFYDTGVAGAETAAFGRRVASSNTLSIVNAGAGSGDQRVEAKTSALGAHMLPNLTTTERDALTAAAGDLIYNTTTSKLEGYDGSAWKETWA